MIEISKLQVHGLDLDYLDLYWEIQDTVEDILDYSIYVQRSEGPMGPWDTLAGPLKDKWFFRDLTVNQRHRSRSYFYRIRIKSDITGKELFSEPASLAAEKDLIGKEISMRMALLLREYAGRKAILFPVRTFGARCPDCWNDILKKTVKDRCLTCYGTGFSSGYLSPMVVYLQFDPAPKSEQATSQGTVADKKATARSIHFPPFKPNDIIVEAENLRWKVMSVSATRKLRAVAHQELQLHQEYPGDISFKIPVNIDLLNFDPSPGREFVNPQGVENLKTREPGIDNIFAAYGYPYNV